MCFSLKRSSYLARAHESAVKASRTSLTTGLTNRDFTATQDLVRRYHYLATHFNIDQRVTMATILDPSLGQLDRLPGKIRNRIYDLTVDSSRQQCDPCKRCQPYVALSLVSKKVRKESVRFIKDAHEEPCTHNRFVYSIPSSWQGD